MTAPKKTTRGPKAVVGPVTPTPPEAIEVVPPAMPNVIEHVVITDSASFVAADGTTVRYKGSGDVIVETPSFVPYKER